MQSTRRGYRVLRAVRYSTSSVRTLSTSLFSIAGVISSTWTVIRLSVAILLYAATLRRLGVSSSTPNGCLSQVITWSARICLPVCDIDEGGRRDDVSAENAVARPLNDCPKQETSHTGCVCTAADAPLEGTERNDNSPIEEDRSSVFTSSIVFKFITLPTGCRSRRKSIQGWTRYRELTRERSSSVLISTIPTAVRARKTHPDVP